MKVLHQVGSRQQRNKVALLINNGKLAFLGTAQNLVRLSQGRTIWCGNKIRRHDRADRIIEGGVELDVSGSNHSNELGAEGSLFYRSNLKSVLDFSKSIKYRGRKRIFSDNNLFLHIATLVAAVERKLCMLGVDWKHHRKDTKLKREKFELTSYGESAKTPLLLEFLRFPHSRVGRKHNRI